MEDIINKFHKNPRKIFNLPEQPNTYVEVDMDEEWVIPGKDYYFLFLIFLNNIN